MKDQELKLEEIEASHTRRSQNTSGILVRFEDSTVLPAFGVRMFCFERELWTTPLERCCSELLLVGFQLACKHAPHLVTQGGIVQVAMIALEEKVEQVSPRFARWNEVHKVHRQRCIARIEHHEQVTKNIVLALTPSAPARLKSEDKTVLEELGVCQGRLLCQPQPMISATKELMRASSRLRTILSNKARRASPRPSAVSSACPFSPRLCDGCWFPCHFLASPQKVCGR